MKTIAFFTLVLFLCACGDSFTGLGSVDLQVTSITFHDSNPATITGILHSGKPSAFIKAADSPLVQSLEVICGAPADTQGMAEANSQLSCPVFYSVNPSEVDQGECLVELKLFGMNWMPDYSIQNHNGQLRVFASARLENMTVQTWQADTVRFLDPDLASVTTATGRITINQGQSAIPWWDAVAELPRPVIKYGWPVPGRWNPLLAVHCPGKGRVESWTDQVYELGDTLFFPADSLVEVSLTWQQLAREYHCFLTVESRTDQVIRWTIQWPDRLPRGADIVPGSPSVQIAPGESATILYKEVY